jgi:hypothetical protein
VPTYEGALRFPGEKGPGLKVMVDLTGDDVIVSAGAGTIARWRRDEMRVNALADGFHVRAEGEEIILDVYDDARFAVDLGLTSAHPVLRRKMSAILREQEG